MLHFFLLQFILGCEQINSTSSEPLVSAEDRALLEKLKREEQAR